ncbi:ROK family transcriptional regulator [Rhizobium tumorigenes]|uniref:ROK family transcriptional regulator n=1 Tax=Rhizobium tumorigenes TaxID=2041385 RepID=UPI00241D4F13|nr:ROK family transcriptional regulator [Rhizobium tumorigenes]WFS03215.1 ROK family transcriptional regulator [Rhizobium tumorigenes]
MKLKGDQGTSRAINRRLILNLLRQEGAKSRAEIASRTGLSPAAVTFVVSDLLEEGHVLEGNTVAGTSGRRPIPISINYANGLAIGFKIMVGAAECVITDLATNPLASMRLSFEDRDPVQIIRTLADAVPELLKAAARPQARLAGIGISVPGVIDNDQAVCVRSHRFNWDNVPLAAMLAAVVKVPVWLEDDTNAYAIAQQLFGLGRQHRNMAVLAIGVGISCAMVVEGKLYRGAHGAAGKFGHTFIEEDGRLCECGKRGCLMAYYSLPSLSASLRAASIADGPVDAAWMQGELAAGNPSVTALVQEAGRSIGRCLANLTNVTDPEVIVVGGEAVVLGDLFLGEIRAALKDHSFRAPPPLLPDWEDDSWARGAAALVTQRFFDFENTAGTIGQETSAFSFAH